MGNEKEAMNNGLAYGRVTGIKPETLRNAQEIFDSRGYRGINESEMNTALTNFETAAVKDRATFSLQLADVYSRIGDAPNTLHWLQETLQTPPQTWPFTVAYIAVEPRFAFLRKNTEFETILEKLRLAS